MDLERSVARVLRIGIYAAMTLLGVGFALMLASGVSPLAGGPALADTDPFADSLAGKPAGLIWLGLIVLVATPAGRVVSALLGYLRARQGPMVVVSISILAVSVRVSCSPSPSRPEPHGFGALVAGLIG